MSRIDDILAFWFTLESDEEVIAAKQRALWWGKGRDEELRIAFGADLDSALSGDLWAWGETARGRLALIVLLDQVTRSVYRDKRRAFSGDARALALCEEGMELGHDRALRRIERVFFYMPLEHAEDLRLQERSVESFKALAAEAEGGLSATLEECVQMAERHRAIVERFGHFPHRNAITGRTSTREELDFLLEPGSSF